MFLNVKACGNSQSFLYALLLFCFCTKSKHVDWDAIGIEKPDFLETLLFPKNFRWGFAESAWQVEGDETAHGKHAVNNWSVWAEKLDVNVGKACERWTRYEADADLMQQCGFTLCRTSIEWSKVEPQKGVFDEAAMDHYTAYIDALKKRGIEPVVMLFHHTWPLWFDEQGAFERAENIPDFVHFCEYVFKRLHSKVKMWMTINEPEGYAMQGYYRGIYPPGKHNFALAGVVLLNFLNAHVAVYKALKAIDPTVSIGFAKVIQPIAPYHSWHPLERFISNLFDSIFNDTSLEFFKTGKFSWRIPAFVTITDSNPAAPQSLDFIGINYYSRTTLKFNVRHAPHVAPTPHPYEKLTDEGRVIYPKGLYRAIKRCSKVGKPMHITENGLSDKQGTQRERFFKQHLYYVSRALKKGYNIGSYSVWTFMDDYEWERGYKPKYGLWAVDFITQERTLRPSSHNFVNFVKAFSPRKKISERKKAVIP